MLALRHGPSRTLPAPARAVGAPRGRRLLQPCAGTRPQTLAQREATCAPVWKSVHAEIDTKGSACTADWECRQVRPEYLGCDAWANLGFKLGEGRIAELENACAPVSFIRSCGGRVGACASGRCTSRPAVQDSASCQAFETALAKALDEPTSCRDDRDCASVWAGEGRRAGPANWMDLFAREYAGATEACPTRDHVSERPGEVAPRASCVQGLCALGPAESEATRIAVKYQKPRELERGCVGRSVKLPSTVAGIPDQVILQFRVSKRGVPNSFGLLTPGSVELLRALAEAVSNCAFEPGRAGDEPRKYRSSFRFASNAADPEAAP